MTATSLIRGLPEARRNEAAALFRARGVPHRRIEDWKYTDLRAALGEAGVGAVVAQWLVANLPHGVEIFDLSQPNPPDWVREHFAAATDNTMSAASLALSAGGVALRVPKGTAIRDPLKLDFTGTGHVRALAGAGGKRLADPGRGRGRCPTSAMSDWRSCWARMPGWIMCGCRPPMPTQCWWRK